MTWWALEEYIKVLRETHRARTQVDLPPDQRGSVKPVRLAATGARRCGEILNLLVEDAALSLIADLRTDIESA